MPLVNARTWLMLPVMLVGIFAGATVWGSVASWLERPCSWMAIIVALDLVLLTHLCKIPGGWLRAATAGVAFVITVILSHYLSVSFILAQWLGIDLLHSMSAIGPVLVWELGLATGTLFDLGWLGLGLVLTVWGTR